MFLKGDHMNRVSRIGAALLALMLTVGCPLNRPVTVHGNPVTSTPVITIVNVVIQLENVLDAANKTMLELATAGLVSRSRALEYIVVAEKAVKADEDLAAVLKTFAGDPQPGGASQIAQALAAYSEAVAAVTTFVKTVKQ
jgi:hypothetical protein